MRVLHTSDWHIGRNLYGRKRNEEFEPSPLPMGFEEAKQQTVRCPIKRPFCETAISFLKNVS